MFEKRHSVGCRLETSAKEALEYLAQQDSRSLSNYIEHILKSELKRKVRQLPKHIKNRG